MMVRPMLAASKYREAGDLWGPKHEEIVQGHLDKDGYLIMQPKWDGFRMLHYQGIPMSRSGISLTNLRLQQFVREHPEFEGLDGEILPGHRYAASDFRKAMSQLRSGDGAGDMTFVFYDKFDIPEFGYPYRRQKALEQVGDMTRLVEGDGYAVILMECPQVPVTSLEEIYDEEARLIGLNHEGGITRRHNRQYKFNRSTALGGELTKVKRRNTVDAIVRGYKQRYENHNEATQSALGFTKRSAHKAGKVPVEMLGALELELLDGSGTLTDCGVFRGLTHGDLGALWTERETLTGRYCEVSVDGASGGYDSARCPVWLRWRDASEF